MSNYSLLVAFPNGAKNIINPTAEAFKDKSVNDVMRGLAEYLVPNYVYYTYTTPNGKEHTVYRKGYSPSK